MKKRIYVLTLLFFVCNIQGQITVIREKGKAPVIQVEPLKPEIVNFTPFVWNTPTPQDCPFLQSTFLSKIKFLGVKRCALRVF